jgi:hypothetical protein
MCFDRRYFIRDMADPGRTVRVRGRPAVNKHYCAAAAVLHVCGGGVYGAYGAPLR